MHLRSGHRMGGHVTPDWGGTNARGRKKARLSPAAEPTSSTDTSHPVPDSPPSHVNQYAEEFPAMSELFGSDYDPKDDATRMKMHRLVSEFIRLESNGRSLHVRETRGKASTWVKIPRNGSDAGFRKQAAEWIEPLIDHNTHINGDNFDSAKSVSPSTSSAITGALS